jgi:hypothetical protein
MFHFNTPQSFYIHINVVLLPITFTHYYASTILVCFFFIYLLNQKWKVQQSKFENTIIINMLPFLLFSYIFSALYFWFFNLYSSEFMIIYTSYWLYCKLCTYLYIWFKHLIVLLIICLVVCSMYLIYFITTLTESAKFYILN